VAVQAIERAGTKGTSGVGGAQPPRREVRVRRAEMWSIVLRIRFFGRETADLRPRFEDLSRRHVSEPVVVVSEPGLLVLFLSRA